MLQTRTMRVAVAAAMVILCASPVLTFGNPTIARYEPFASSVPGSPEQRAELARYVRSYGLDRFRPEDIAMLEARLATFVPVLVETQGVGMGLQPSVFRFVQEHGSPTDRQRLARAVSTWMSEDTLYAPPVNGMRVVAPDAIVRHEAVNAQRWAAYWYDQLTQSGAEPTPRDEPASAGLRFDSEYVRLTVDREFFEVLGTYRFSGDPSTPAQPMHYPFPHDSALGEPEVIGVWVQPVGEFARATDVTVDPGGRNWRLQRPVPAGSTLRVHYRQQYDACRIRYLLTSTQDWGAPIGQALFRVTIPANGYPPSFNHPFRVIERDTHTTVYELEAEDFCPSEDLILEWCSPASGGTGSVELVIESHTGAPPSGAPRITLNGNRNMFTHESDDVFVAQDVPAGTLDLTVDAVNSLGTKGTVLVLPDTTTRLHVVLVRKFARWAEI